MHDVLRQMFLPMKEIVVGTRSKMVPVSTTSLTTSEMSDYIDRVAAFAASELGLALPLPEEAYA